MKNFILSLFVNRIGFEPMTYCLEGSCSIQLSYRSSLDERKSNNFPLNGKINQRFQPVQAANSKYLYGPYEKFR